MTPEHPDDVICKAIENALDKQDLPAVASLLKMLALQAPDKAEAIMDAINGKFTFTFDLTGVRND